MVLGAMAAGAASASTDAPDVVHPHLDDANVDEAAVGITLFLLDNSANAGGTITAPCPADDDRPVRLLHGPAGTHPQSGRLGR